MARVATQFSARQMQILDRLVAEGVGESRSDVIQKALECLAESVERDRASKLAGQIIAESYRRQPQSEAEAAMGRKVAEAVVEAEPW